MIRRAARARLEPPAVLLLLALVAPDLSRAEPANAPLALRPVALYGADIRSLVFDPASPDRAFAGSSAGHVYRSDDGGSTWRNAGEEAPFGGHVVASLAFDPDRPGRLWAALWGIWGGGIVAHSDDLGATWTRLPLGPFAADQVYALARPAGVPGRIVIGTRAGVLLSDDSGTSWRPVGRDVPGLTQVSSLLVDPLRPERLLAGTWRRAFRSDDGGASWRGVFDGMVLDTEVFSLHGVPGTDGELWASSCGWVYRADGFGDKWSRRQNGLAERRTPSFAVVSPERLLAGTVSGAFLSTDGGESFRRTSRDDLAVLAIAFHPARPERILLGTEGSGVWQSNDGGSSFAPRPVGMRNVRVAALARSGDQLFAALAHAGPSSGVYRSPDGGVSFEPTPANLPGVLALAPARHRLLAATEGGLFERVGVEWRRLGEAGTARVDELAVEGDRFVARAGAALFESSPDGAKLAKVDPPRQKPPAPPVVSATLAGGELWTLREDGLFRRQGGVPVASPRPASRGRLHEAGGELVLAGPDGLFRRDAKDGAWNEVTRDSARALPTSNGRFPMVFVAAGKAALYDRELGRRIPLDEPFPASETLSAEIVGDRLFVGTSGYGLWEARLPE